jgi:5'-methylthioadenosine phosphorylase
MPERITCGAVDATAATEPPLVTGHRLAVISGSGLHDHTVGAQSKVVEVTVPGASGADQRVELEEHGSFVLLRRHSSTNPGGATPAHLVDHHANIRALCQVGCDRVMALSSVGSLHPDWGAGTIVVPDDYLAFDATPTYYADTRGHCVPGFDREWRATVIQAWQAASGTRPIDRAVYAQTRGPRFETPAEVRLLADYADLVGMTVASEVHLATEAGLAYAAVCKIDNLGNGLDEDPLTIEEYRANTLATLDAFVTDVLATVRHLTTT